MNYHMLKNMETHGVVGNEVIWNSVSIEYFQGGGRLETGCGQMIGNLECNVKNVVGTPETWKV